MKLFKQAFIQTVRLYQIQGIDQSDDNIYQKKKIWNTVEMQNHMW